MKEVFTKENAKIIADAFWGKWGEITGGELITVNELSRLFSGSVIIVLHNFVDSLVKNGGCKVDEWDNIANAIISLIKNSMEL